jgi:hypothetical protein
MGKKRLDKRTLCRTNKGKSFNATKNIKEVCIERKELVAIILKDFLKVSSDSWYRTLYSSVLYTLTTRILKNCHHFVSRLKTETGMNFHYIKYKE